MPTLSRPEIRTLKSLYTCLLFLFTSNYGQSQTIDTLKINAIFADWNHSNEPGGAVGIVKSGKLIYGKGFGMADLEHNIPISPRSVFYLASLAKQFTAFCILLLEEQGKLNLKDEIQKYLPDFPRYERPITIAQLIHHTSGLRDFSTLIDLQGRSYLEDISEREVYELIKNQKSLNFLPSDEYMYCNSGYFLLSKIIETVTKQTLKAFAAKHIFEPLGMKSTTFLDDNGLILKNRAFSYEKNLQGGFNNIIRRYALVGSGGVYSSIEDLALWDQNFYHNLLGKGNQKIMAKMVMEDTLTNGLNSGYAFGLENKLYKGLSRVSHSGSNAGYRTFFIRFPGNELTVILLSNRRDGDLNKVFKVVDEVLGLKAPNTSTQNPVSLNQDTIGKNPVLSDLDLEKLGGRYYSQELLSSYNISKTGESLYLSVNNGEPTPLKIKSPNVLLSETFGELTFSRKKNKITGFDLSIARVRKLSFTKIKD